ncbi:PP2C family protein-serine/threonine phosphatase [Streptomyces sp. NPDC056512]|uniref:PP2C family protein-serine/threonine phosphatase n=1 Tax=Streptomyces sp. NPDC056512 TaxID=3345846 RepID=UPI00367E48C8
MTGTTSRSRRIPIHGRIRTRGPPPRPYALATGEAVLLPTLEGSEDWVAHDRHRAGKMATAGVHSVMVVPLRARDVTLGVAHFYRWQRPDPFDADDLTVAGEVVARAAVCVDNARRYTRERDAALTLQRRLLQVTTPQLSAATTAHRYRPSGSRTGVAGDWFDIIPLSGARVGLIVGDVPGRGIHAVAEAGRLRTAVRALAQQDLSPDELLIQLDGIVSQAADGEDTPGAPTAGIGGSCLYAVYDPVSHRCTFACAAPRLPVPDGGQADVVRAAHKPTLAAGVRHTGHGTATSRVRAMTTTSSPSPVTSSMISADSPEYTVPIRELPSITRS